MQIRFLPEADTDLAEARVWYGLQRDGLDVELMWQIDETLHRISNAPRRFRLIHRHLRRAIVKKFPFAVFYEVSKNEIVVFAMFHARRNPKHLTSRLKHIG